MTFQHVFGPIPSRRLGVSLGVDIVPAKTCSLNCVYCECGKTTRLISTPEPFMPAEAITDELDQYLKNNPKLDHITFSGAGEPTLNPAIGHIIRFIRTHYPAYKIALLTNSTLLSDPSVCNRILAADTVIASLDAATQTVFKKINRPHPSLDIQSVIRALTHFRKQYAGRLVIEIFIVPGINDTDDELNALKTALSSIRPDLIQLNALDRPGTEPWVTRVDDDRLNALSTLFFNTQAVTAKPAVMAINAPDMDIDDLIVSTLKRRPLTIADMEIIAGMDKCELEKRLIRLQTSGLIGIKKMARGLFYHNA